jgi:E1A-binding protein p400
MSYSCFIGLLVAISNLSLILNKLYNFFVDRSCLPGSLSSSTKSMYGTRDNSAGEWRINENIFPHLPRSMFDRASGALLKMRNDIRIQRYRGINRPMTMTLASLKPPLPARPVPEPPHVPDWLIHEDYALLQVSYYIY